jgi:hypothetical protein
VTPESHGPTEADFLSDLKRQLLASPDESLTRLHVGRSARVALKGRTQRRRRARQTGFVAIAISTLLSTSGVAVAGRLPSPVQVIVADAARLLPLPLPIPYPAAPLAPVHHDPSSLVSTAPGVISDWDDTGIQSSDEASAPTETAARSAGDVAAENTERRTGNDTERSNRREDRRSNDEQARETGDDGDFLEGNDRSERPDR